MPAPDCTCYAQRLSTTDHSGRPALFLDRDGVVVEETNYLHRIADVRIIAGMPEAIARANARGLAVIMVTNQAGIGRGYYDWQEFEAVQDHILRELARFGGRFDMILACAAHHEGQGDYAAAEHPWRKPRPGMLLEAAAETGVDLSRSFIIGDTFSDLDAGRAAGLCGGALVATGHGEREWREKGLLRSAESAGSAFSWQRHPDGPAAIDWRLATMARPA